ncbi:MAG: (2Fe-2S)-binding protein [Bradymonadales bacterium]|nr:(2Fe-2S)-binding protein [Bradymonadales bacterium]
MNIWMIVNGERREVDVPPMKRLLDTLREDLNLTGTKEGCGEGECGACLVLVNGQAVNSCLVATGQVQGAEIWTVEGLASSPEELTDLQSAFLTYGAVQCGFCTPGMLMTAHAYLRHNPDPTRDQIREAISGNLCRCTGYQKIVDAIEAVAKRRQTEPGEAP